VRAASRVQSKVLTHWFDRRCLSIGRISLADVGRMQCAYCSFLCFFNCCAMVRYAVHEKRLGVGQNGIADTDAVRVVKVSTSAKSTRGSALGLKSYMY